MDLNYYSDWYAVTLEKLKQTGYPIPEEEVFVFAHMDNQSPDDFIQQYKKLVDDGNPPVV